MDFTELTKAFGAFFAIMNPFVNLPIFLALTTGFTVSQQRMVVVKMVLFSAVMCIVIVIAGQRIISLLGISVEAFRVAGGLVLASIAWSMLNGSSVTSHQGTATEKGQMTELTSLAFYPITFPIIVGPGTIATIIIYAGQAKRLEETLAVTAVIAVVLLILFAVLFFASAFGKVLSDTMRVITMRLMGMILLAISVQMVIDGLKAVLPGLG